jgi:dolichol-phosphate mannosyltransferase
MAMTPRLAPLLSRDFRLSVVLPVYSETDSVPAIVERLREFFGRQLEEIVIVLSPKSSAESRHVIENLCEADSRVRLHVQRINPGLGNAVREGIALTRGNLVLLMDSDGEMEIDTVPQLSAEIAKGHHAAVFASRWSKGGGFSGYSKLKYCLNWGFQLLFRVLFWTSIRDLTYGFKLMRGEVARGIAWEGTLHEIACETTLKPIRLGFSVAQVPTRWTARTRGDSKNAFWRNFRYVAMALRVLFRGVEFRAESPVSNRAAVEPILARASS